MSDPRSTSLRAMLLAALFASLTSVLSLIRIPVPFTPVPITGQTVAVMLAGAILGPHWGAISQMLYVAMGIVGLPVFAGGTAGFSVLVGPTGGYLVGFIAGAWTTGVLLPARPGFGVARALSAALAGGVVVVYLFGIPWLSIVAGLSLRKALLVGALPFLPGDIAKAVVVALLLPRLCRLLHVPGYRNASGEGR